MRRRGRARSAELVALTSATALVAVGCSLGGLVFDRTGVTGFGGSGAQSSSASGSTTQSSSEGAGGAGDAGGAGGAGGAPAQVTCGSSAKICLADDMDACCWNTTMNAGRCVKGAPGSDGCDTSMALLGRETRITCQTAADCAFKKPCCATRMGNGFPYYSDVSCLDTCPVTDATVPLCDPMFGGCPMSGMVSLACKPDPLLPAGYSTCVPP